MRHLFYAGGEAGKQTLCGLPRAGHSAVHVTKARKTDCFTCRLRFRASVRDRAGKKYMTKAERETLR